MKNGTSDEPNVTGKDERRTNTILQTLADRLPFSCGYNFDGQVSENDVSVSARNITSVCLPVMADAEQVTSMELSSH